MDGHDSYHISKSKGDYDRTIGILTVIALQGSEKETKTTDFNITQEESGALFENGVRVAQDFLERWGFEGWKEKYR